MVEPRMALPAYIWPATTGPFPHPFRQTVLPPDPVCGPHLIPRILLREQTSNQEQEENQGEAFHTLGCATQAQVAW